MGRRVILIGLDGVPFGLIKKYTAEGIMPHLAQVISRGNFFSMTSSIPEVSCVAWSSIITGKSPGEHGIFGFTDFHPSSYRVRFPNYGDLGAPPFWELIPGESIIINPPATYPVRKMRGVHISGFVSIELEKSVYPPELIGKLREFDYRLDVDAEKAQQSLELFVEDVSKTLQSRLQAFCYLWDYKEWQVFMLVFTATDRLMHFLWDAYEDSAHRYHQAFEHHFRTIDGAIGELQERAGEEDLILIFSDHGFGRLEREVYVNRLLEQEGFLRFRNPAVRDLQQLAPTTKAFALDPARIYLNLKGRFPQGSVNPEEREKVLEELIALCYSLEFKGTKVVKNIYRQEEIYSGPYMERAPDLVLMGEEGFDLKARLNAEQLFGTRLFTGKHTFDDAFLVISGPYQSESVQFNVADVAGIVCEFLSPSP